MSENNNKENEKDKLEIKLKIDKKLWRRIEAQVDFLKEMKIPELESISSPEDLLLFYVEQLSMPDKQLNEVNTKISEVFQEFYKKGINMRNLLNSFTHEHNSNVSEEDEEEEEIDWDVEDQ